MERLAIHQNAQLIIIFGKLSLRIKFRQRGHRRATCLGGGEAVCAAAIQQIIDEALNLIRAGPRAHEGQRGECSGFSFLAGPRVVAHTGGIKQSLVANLFLGQFFRQHIEQLTGEFLAIQIHKRQRRVRQRGGAERVALAMEPVGVREIRGLVYRQRVEQYRFRVVIPRAELCKLRAQKILRLVQRVRVHGDARVARSAKRPERRGRDAPVRTRAATAPHPAAVLFLAYHQRTGQRADADAQPVELRGARLGFARKLQRAHCRQ